MSDSESSEEGHESDCYPDGSTYTYYQAQTATSPDAALAAGHRRPDAYDDSEDRTDFRWFNILV